MSADEASEEEASNLRTTTSTKRKYTRARPAFIDTESKTYAPQRLEAIFEEARNNGSILDASEVITPFVIFNVIGLSRITFPALATFANS